MTRPALLVLALSLAACAPTSPSGPAAGQAAAPSAWTVPPPPAPSFALTSAAFAEGGAVPEAHVFDGFGCSGGNASPPLAWSGAPEGTRSFAVTAYDPDAPTGSGWWHWVVYDLPPSARSLAAGASGAGLPAGAVEGRTDFGATGYGGPCPPEGASAHRYVFSVHALDVETLGVPPDASPALVGFMLGSHTLARATLTARYGR